MKRGHVCTDMPLPRIFGLQVMGPLAALILLLIVLAVAAPGPLIAIRSVNPKTGQVVLNNPQHAFNADQYVEGIWKSKVTPWVAQHEVNLDQLLSMLASNRKHAEKQFGTTSEEGVHNFVVHGQAQVASVNTSTPVGKIKLSSPDWHNHDVSLLAGPLIFSTALRDVFPFLQFDDFMNQVQYANVAESMNKYAIKQAYSGLKVKQLKGRTIKFTGAFTESPDGSVTIVPIDVKVKP